LAVIGALGIMLSIAVDPFIQNLVGYHKKPILVPNQIAYVANNAIYEPGVYLHSSGSRTLNHWELMVLGLTSVPLVLDIDPQLRGSIFNALDSSDA
jgi:hypothetical protein